MAVAKSQQRQRDLRQQPLTQLAVHHLTPQGTLLFRHCLLLLLLVM
jgi:hypothetical protein